ncbi:MAG: hypothetical protein OXQ96_05710, partial [Alphaproteobacteria bacterium]|nr:hypothetical protein [Alphaproteobacteria bacterium]
IALTFCNAILNLCIAITITVIVYYKLFDSYYYKPVILISAFICVYNTLHAYSTYKLVKNKKPQYGLFQKAIKPSQQIIAVSTIIYATYFLLPWNPPLNTWMSFIIAVFIAANLVGWLTGWSFSKQKQQIWQDLTE